MPQEERPCIPLAAQEGDQRIDPADQVPAQQDGDRPGQDDPGTTFAVDDPADKEKNPTRYAEEGNDPPGIFQQFLEIPEIAQGESVDQGTGHDRGKNDQVEEGNPIAHMKPSSTKSRIRPWPRRARDRRRL